MKRNYKKRGFVLIIVLLVLAIAGTLLGITAYNCSRQVLQASNARQDLQNKWANQCFRTVLMPQISKKLDEQNEDSRTFENSLTRTIRLGDKEYTLLLADEQAKVNVNSVLYIYGGDTERVLADLSPRLKVIPDDLEQFKMVIKEATSRPADDTPKIMPIGEEMRPSRQPTTAMKEAEMEAIPQLFQSPDMFFVFDKPSELIQPAGIKSMPLDKLTFWSDGKLNFKTADSKSITALTSKFLTSNDVQKLISLRNENPKATVSELISNLALNVEAARLAKGVFTDKSKSFSLWVFSEGKVDSNCSLFVMQSNERSAKSVRGFQW